MNKISHWTDAHITYDQYTGYYTGWDEAGDDTVMTHQNRFVVVLALGFYAARLLSR